jgi:hypothetical protein
MVLVDDPKDFRFASIEHGVVMVFAEWSGGAPLMLKKYSQLMNTLQPKDIKLYVLNNDSLQPFDMEKIFGEPLHGYAETYFVRGGKVLGKITRPNEKAEADFTAQFDRTFGGDGGRGTI